MIPNYFKCPISLQIMCNPYICSVDGVTYEYAEICKCKESPITRAPFKITDLILNRALKDTIEAYIVDNPELKNEVYVSYNPSIININKSSRIFSNINLYTFITKCYWSYST